MAAIRPFLVMPMRKALAALVLALVAMLVSWAAPSGAPALRAAAGGSWTTYHHDNGHTGYDPTAPAFSAVGPTSGWNLTALDAEVYAEPLINNGLVYAATLNNTVYALSQTDGTIVWQRNLGVPVASGWSCGNVAPQGILGTPVIDSGGGRIYVAALLNTDHVYHVFGLDLATGAIGMNTPIPTNLGSGFDWTIQQERGALSFANGYVYVPFGGRTGDCGAYHGWVFGVPTNGGPVVNFYQTPSTGSGIWAAGGIVVDGTGNVFAATGNAVGSGCNSVDQNDAVVRLAPNLGLQDYFMPADWQSNWCSNDQDLGSASPLLINSNLLFTSGKWGGGFLVNPASLGGVDGQLYPARNPYNQAEVCLGNHSDATFGSFAYAAPFIYVECEGQGLVALNVNTGAPSFSPCNSTCGAPNWHAGGSTTFGPPIVAGGAVWAASNSGLYAFNATTGAQIFHSASFGINRFVTPSEAGGQVFVPSHTVIRSFSFNPVTFTPTQLDFNAGAPGATSATQTVTLHNNQSTTLNVSTAVITGANAADYTKVVDNCSAQAVGAGGTCTVQVNFHPPAFGGFPANLTFTDDANGSPQQVQLNGLGALDNTTHMYTLDGWGGFHADGASPVLPSTGYWPYFNIARSFALFPDGQGGYLLDGYGGVHPIGNANPVGPVAFWPNYDIARQIVLAPWATVANPAGWTLDGWGGVHPFGGAPQINGTAFWQGWDIARGLVILPDSTPSAMAGYTLDGWGGIHPFGGALPVFNNAFWQGWDIARGITLSPNASKTNPAGWTLDGWGGVHAFGAAPALPNTAYWPNWDIARGIVEWTGTGAGGWVLDGYGGIHAFGAAPSINPVAFFGWDIATGVGGPVSSSGSRHHS